MVFQSSAQDKSVKSALAKTDSVVWAGLDYSMMRMIGTQNDLKVPDLIFQDVPKKWNDLFLDERIEGVANSLEKHVLIDIDGVTERNKLLSTNQIIVTNDSRNISNESHISPDDIGKAVKAYRLHQSTGLGLVFIVDRMAYRFVPPSPYGNTITPGHVAHEEAVYVVYFDVASREIISAKREISPVALGEGFRNFWFGPIKNIDSQLGKYR